MGHRFGAYTWLLYQDESGKQLLIRSTDVTDDVQGTLYVTEAGNPVWLTEGATGLSPSHRYPTDVGQPSGLTVVDSATAGTLTPTDEVAYRIAARGFDGGTTEAIAEVTHTLGAGKTSALLSWTNPAGGSDGTEIYGRTAAGELFMINLAPGVTSWTDTGAITPDGVLPTEDTTSATDFESFNDINHALMDLGNPIWMEQLSTPTT